MIEPAIFNEIFVTGNSFTNQSLQIYEYQHQQNLVYKDWCRWVYKNYPPGDITSIPFLPVSFFKTHQVLCAAASDMIIFESSGTTKSTTSRHFVPNISLYDTSFLKAFQLFYGAPQNWCILALLPAYLERSNSSLVYMANKLISLSGHTDSDFFLYDFSELHERIQRLERAGTQTLLLGVSFALLDFAQAYPQNLQHTIVMETGGMKGRKIEMIRAELHEKLCRGFGVTKIHSEYGMTELLSQAYSDGNGRYRCPPWMQVLVRNEDDPLDVKETGKGLINIIDHANLYSCSFIATDDAGIVYEDGSFEIMGRSDNSDIRGCSLLAV